MADTIRKQILNLIDARFKTILVANGYNTNIGQSVFYWRQSDLGQDEMPSLTYRDRPDPVEAGPGISERTLQIDIEGFAKGVSEAAAINLLDQIGADIEKAVGVDDMWNGLALTTESEGPGWEIKRGEYFIGAVRFVLKIPYRTKRWDPYTLGY